MQRRMLDLPSTMKDVEEESRSPFGDIVSLDVRSKCSTPWPSNSTTEGGSRLKAGPRSKPSCKLTLSLWGPSPNIVREDFRAIPWKMAPKKKVLQAYPVS